jgi:hypothetical protein
MTKGCPYCHRVYVSADQARCDGCGAPRLIEQATVFIDPFKAMEADLLDINYSSVRARMLEFDLVER